MLLDLLVEFAEGRLGRVGALLRLAGGTFRAFGTFPGLPLLGFGFGVVARLRLGIVGRPGSGSRPGSTLPSSGTTASATGKTRGR